MNNLLEDFTPRKAITLLRFLYPLWAVLGMFSIIYVPSALIVSGDAAKTATNIINNELLMRMGIVGSLLTQIIFIITALVLYRLFAHINKNYALLMVVFALVAVPIAMLNTLNSVAALSVLNNAEYLNVFGVGQKQGLMMLFLDIEAQGIMIATIFWGLWLFPLGMLVYKSGFFPKVLGIILILAGLGYVLDALTHLALPNYERYEPILTPVVTLLTIGEVIFMLWVLFKGAKIPSAKSEVK